MSRSTPTAASDTALPFPTVLEPVQVPLGYFPIEVVQFWRGEHAPGHPLPLHWVIIIRTSAHRGNAHEIIGDTHTYATQHRFDVPLTGLHQREDWRGSHVVGYVSPSRLNDLLKWIARTSVVRHRWTWNCQHWVCDALQGLHHRDLYTDVNMTLASLQTHMCCLLEAWEIGFI